MRRCSTTTKTAQVIMRKIQVVEKRMSFYQIYAFGLKPMG